MTVLLVSAFLLYINRNFWRDFSLGLCSFSTLVTIDTKYTKYITQTKMKDKYMHRQMAKEYVHMQLTKMCYTKTFL